MAKRKIDEVEAREGKEGGINLTPLKEKIKKNKGEKSKSQSSESETITEESGHNGITNGVHEMELDNISEAISKEKKDKKKKEKKEKRKRYVEEEDGLSKEERKAAKAVRKLAKLAKKEKKEKKEKVIEEEEAAAKPSSDSEVEEQEQEPTSVPYTTPGTSAPSSNGTLTPVNGVTSATNTDVTKYMIDNAITVFDPLNPEATTPSLSPIRSFSDLPSQLEGHLKPFATYKTPTPIQSVSWPYLLAKRDLIGVAETGSGKTMAFAYPAVRYLLSLPKEKKNKSGAKVVVVSPTRELAMQIFEQMESVALAAGLQESIVCVYGGVPKDPQRAALRKATIIVATPGRLVDFLEEGGADISSAGYVVLDEADRMLDKGFEDAIKSILSNTPATPNRQTLMFTATWPQSVRQLASTFMTKPVKIGINTPPDGDLRANIRITQTVHVLADPRSKEQRLLSILQSHQRTSANAKNDRILVFALYKKEATRIELFLRSKGIKVGGIHGDLNQAARTAALAEFKAGRTPVLVATDVAARGLDIPNVKLVVNVTFPLTVEDYVHRIGRTGRAGESGLAITLFTEHDKAHSGRYEI